MAHPVVRTSELIGARWEEINLEEKRWDIPASRMKMKTPHIVPLSRQSVEQLTGNGALLFLGERDPKKSMSNNTILVALSRMGYKGVMTGHGFRGVASTLLHEHGWPHDHIELQLAHAPRNAVSASYNHAVYLEPRAKMLQAWSNFLEQTQRGGKVLPFTRAWLKFPTLQLKRGLDGRRMASIRHRRPSLWKTSKVNVLLTTDAIEE
jgi:integrase